MKYNPAGRGKKPSAQRQENRKEVNEVIESIDKTRANNPTGIELYGLSAAFLWEETKDLGRLRASSMDRRKLRLYLLPTCTDIFSWVLDPTMALVFIAYGIEVLQCHQLAQ